MHRFVLIFAVMALATPLPAADRNDPEPIKVASTDWPWWRGPNRNGIANSEVTPPTSWSSTENILWKSPIPGRGHGSPIVVGNQVVLQTADEENDGQWVLSFNRDTGDELWKTEVFDNGITRKGNKKASQASSAPAFDGGRFFVNFLNDGAVYTTALSLDGRQIWQTKITDYTVHQGYGSSPAPYGPLVIVSGDNKGKSGGVVAGLHRKTGRIMWQHSRPSIPNYSSPVILKTAGRDQLIMTGCKLVTSFDPASGEKLWEIAGATEECVTSTVTDGVHVYSTGGYPKNHVAAIRADGSGKVEWENKTRVYVPSMLLYDGYIYAVADAGFAVCWNAATGEEKWKGRLGGTFSSSPVLVNGLIMATNEAGTTFVFKATPQAFEQVGENKLGGQVFATPAIVGGRIFMRVAEGSGKDRQEMLYCIGEN